MESVKEPSIKRMQLTWKMDSVIASFFRKKPKKIQLFAQVQNQAYYPIDTPGSTLQQTG